MAKKTGQSADSVAAQTGAEHRPVETEAPALIEKPGDPNSGHIDWNDPRKSGAEAVAEALARQATPARSDED